MDNDQKTDMQYRSLGSCGTKVSAFGLGGWATYGESVNDVSLIKSIFREAFDAGVNFFDFADAYGGGKCEELMGEVLEEFPRNNIVLTSKAFWPMSDDINDRGLSRKHLFYSVDQSLKRLRTDYLDIFFCHRFDPETPLEETIRAMDDLVHQGKVLYWGTSEWTGAQLDEANELARSFNLYRPQVEQPQYSLLMRTKVEEDVLPAVERSGMGVVVWSPLGSGILTGKYDQGVPEGSRLSRIEWLKDMVLTDDNIAKVRQLKTIADQLGCTRAQLALRWAADQQGISSVIMGASTTEQLRENLGAVKVQISEEVSQQLQEIFPRCPMPQA